MRYLLYILFLSYIPVKSQFLGIYSNIDNQTTQYSGYDLFIKIGESNSGGVTSVNDSAQSSELEETSAIQVLNNYTKQFENLQIAGVNSNNILLHRGIEYGPDSTHGWELQISNLAEIGMFPKDTVFLLTCGQGGTKISNWVNDVVYSTATHAFDTFLTRLDTASAQLEGKELRISYLMSLGFNDGNAGTNVDTFKTKMGIFIDSLTYYSPTCNIYATQTHEDYRTLMLELQSEKSNFFVIETNDLQLYNSHWRYSGMKVIANRMINAILNQ